MRSSNESCRRWAIEKMCRRGCLEKLNLAVSPGILVGEIWFSLHLLIALIAKGGLNKRSCFFFFFSRSLKWDAVYIETLASSTGKNPPLDNFSETRFPLWRADWRIASLGSRRCRSCKASPGTEEKQQSVWCKETRLFPRSGSDTGCTTVLWGRKSAERWAVCSEPGGSGGKNKGTLNL